MDKEKYLESLEARIVALENEEKITKYVLFGHNSLRGIVVEIEDHGKRIKAIEEAFIRWGGIIVGAQIAIEVVSTLFNNYK